MGSRDNAGSRDGALIMGSRDNAVSMGSRSGALSMGSTNYGKQG